MKVKVKWHGFYSPKQPGEIKPETVIIPDEALFNDNFKDEAVRDYLFGIYGVWPDGWEEIK